MSDTYTYLLKLLTSDLTISFFTGVITALLFRFMLTLLTRRAITRKVIRPLSRLSGAIKHDAQGRRDKAGWRVRSLQIRNFRCITSLDISFSAASTLPGDWVCIAGINGAGKTSILQATCLTLLGRKHATEMGVELLRDSRRRTPKGSEDSRILAVIEHGDQQMELFLPLGEDGVDEKLLMEEDLPAMEEAWRALQSQVFVSYGATRNLSKHRDPQESGRLSQIARKQLSLFEPLTQIASVDVLLASSQKKSKRPLDTLSQLLDLILEGEDFESWRSGDRITFTQAGVEVDVFELPDGFRSTVAWLTDLCATWHEVAQPSTTDPRQMTGIVLLDEISLHLHTGLQRSLVSRIRDALPMVQFIVTTHSPLILAGFDRNELVILDRDKESGVRQLDRQVFGMSMDDVYEYLMDTNPSSTVIKNLIEEGLDEKAAMYMYQSKDVDEEEAAERLRLRKRALDRLRKDEGQS